MLSRSEQLVGVLPVRHLVLLPGSTKVGSIMVRNIIMLHQKETLFDAMELFAMHRLLAIPVVNDERKFQGIVEVSLYTEEVFDLALARGLSLRADGVSRTLGYVDTLPAEATASMQRDILEGKPSELEYQSGAIVRLGREARLPVPVNECIYRSLLPAEAKARGLRGG